MKKISKIFSSIVIACAAMICFAVMSNAADANANGKWIAAWGTGPTDISLEGYSNIAVPIGNASARVVLTPTANGDKIRLRFSNYYGENVLKLTNVTVAASKNADSIDLENVTSKIDTSTITQVTFGGNNSVSIPVGQEIYSDPINFKVEAMKNIAVTMYAGDFSFIHTMGLSGGTTFLSFGSDKTYDADFGLTQYIPDAVTQLLSVLLPSLRFELPLSFGLVKVVPCLAGIDVLSDKDAYSIAVVGDSTVANEFPVYLADKINNTYGVHNVGVLGKGIIGNMLCGEENSIGGNLYGKNLVKRFKQDVADQAGIKYVFVKIGANDILHPVCGENADEANQPSADDLIDGLIKICDMTHEMGAKVILSTITQWKGTTRDYFGAGASYVRTESEFEHDWQIAKDVNAWIKSSNNEYVDGYVDYVALSGDKKDPAKYADEYTDDYIHPNDALQKLWAKNFPLELVDVHKRTQSIKLDKSSVKLYINGGSDAKATVKATITPSDAENKKLTWTSSNSSVASVSNTTSSKVTITAKKDGTAIITCTAKDGGAMAKVLVYVKTNPSSVKISDSLSLYARQSKTLKATVSPSNAYDKSVTWKSSNTKVATVSSKGVVTGVGKGTATITCTTKVGSKTSKCTVKVKKPTDVSSVHTSVTSKSVYKGKTYKISANVSPSNATFKTLKWKSSNKKVATVDSNGVVKAISAGTATITCTSADNPTASAKVKIKVIVKATGIKLTASKLSVYRTDSKALKVKFTPSDATNKNVTWTSSNKKVATVSSNGTVKGIKKGKATITCKSKDGGFVAKCTVEVKNIVASKSVKLNVKEKTVKVGSTYKLKPSFSPSKVTLKNVTWKSSNSKIAKVNSKGVVTGVKAGKATITCTTKDTGKTAKCVITVKNVTPSSVKLNKSEVKIASGVSTKLKATVLPDIAYNKKVTWTSSNTSVATVSSKGKVTAKKPGVAVITCKTESGKKTATCKVTVSGVKVNQIKLNKTDVKLAYGKTTQLTAKVSPSNATNKKVKWTSSDPSVASVDSKGNIRAVNKGSVIITCTATDGSGATAECVVTVTKKSVLGLELNSTKLSMSTGAVYKLVPTFYPSDAADKSITWSSSDSSVAKVDSKGNVTAVGPGSCKIKAKANDGGYIVYCSVTVTK